MPIGIILSAIFVPACVMLVFSAIQKNKLKVSKTMTDEKFTVQLPSIISAIGVICALTATVVMVLHTLFGDELPHIIFYIVFGLFFYLGIYLIVKTRTFRVVVKGKEITVFSAFRKPYTFTFNEIALAKRQVKNNEVKSERIVIRTTTGRKLIVERAEISYERFSKRIQQEVSKERLTGFE